MILSNQFTAGYIILILIILTILIKLTKRLIKKTDRPKNTLPEVENIFVSQKTRPKSKSNPSTITDNTNHSTTTSTTTTSTTSKKDSKFFIGEKDMKKMESFDLRSQAINDIMKKYGKNMDEDTINQIKSKLNKLGYKNSIIDKWFNP